jgi:hypothetical protein
LEESGALTTFREGSQNRRMLLRAKHRKLELKAQKSMSKKSRIFLYGIFLMRFYSGKLIQRHFSIRKNPISKREKGFFKLSFITLFHVALSLRLGELH